jgi:NhaP-type Na+/H+ or K+/H+ antiporter
MTAGLIGAAIGLLLGVISWRTLSILAERVEKPETKKLLGIVGAFEIVLMPVIGYVIATLGFGEPTQGAAP